MCQLMNTDSSMEHNRNKIQFTQIKYGTFTESRHLAQSYCMDYTMGRLIVLLANFMYFGWNSAFRSWVWYQLVHSRFLSWVFNLGISFLFCLQIFYLLLFGIPFSFHGLVMINPNNTEAVVYKFYFSPTCLHSYFLYSRNNVCASGRYGFIFITFYAGSFWLRSEGVISAKAPQIRRRY